MPLALTTPPGALWGPQGTVVEGPALQPHSSAARPQGTSLLICKCAPAEPQLQGLTEQGGGTLPGGRVVECEALSTRPTGVLQLDAGLATGGCVREGGSQEAGGSRARLGSAHEPPGAWILPEPWEEPAGACICTSCGEWLGGRDTARDWSAWIRETERGEAG